MKFLPTLLAVALAGASAEWRVRAALPVPRTEVAAAAVGETVAVVGGFTADGSSTARADIYRPASDRWRRAADLPAAVNHAAAATLAGHLVIVGGYGARRSAFMLVGDRWRLLARLPAPRAAAGAAVLGGRLFVVGGVGGVGPNGLARNALAYEPRTRSWRYVVGPSPREHLAVAAAGGRIYAIGGRTAGSDTNVATVESWRPGEGRWRVERSVPEARGGTGAAAVTGGIVSVGGEAPAGTIGTVYRYDLAVRSWSRLPDLPTPRHGLGVARVGATVYVVGGGPQPGLYVSDANEALCVGSC